MVASAVVRSSWAAQVFDPETKTVSRGVLRRLNEVVAELQGPPVSEKKATLMFAYLQASQERAERMSEAIFLDSWVKGGWKEDPFLSHVAEIRAWDWGQMFAVWNRAVAQVAMEYSSRE